MLRHNDGFFYIFFQPFYEGLALKFAKSANILSKLLHKTQYGHQKTQNFILVTNNKKVIDIYLLLRIFKL
jgi:hypothetical protein